MLGVIKSCCVVEMRCVITRFFISGRVGLANESGVGVEILWSTKSFARCILQHRKHLVSCESRSRYEYSYLLSWELWPPVLVLT